MKKYKAFIKKVSWLNKENPEADILFNVNGSEYSAFCHPCYFKENEEADVYFSFIEEEISEAAFWSENKEQKKDVIQSESSSWRYYCYGQLKSIHPVTIDCGLIMFDLGDWIKDESSLGSYIYFVIARLDITKF